MACSCFLFWGSILTSVILAAISVACATYIWVSSAPLLIRPVFVWAGSSPTVDAVAPLQEQGIWLVNVLALGAIGRVLLERRGLTGRTARLAFVLKAGIQQQSRTIPGPRQSRVCVQHLMIV